MIKNELLGDRDDLAKKMNKIKAQIDETSAGSTTTEEEKLAPKLFVSGRLDRKKHTYTAKSLTLLSTLEDEIKAYCRGGEVAILNYLIQAGLKKVKESQSIINIDIKDIESNNI